MVRAWVCWQELVIIVAVAHYGCAEGHALLLADGACLQCHTTVGCAGLPCRRSMRRMIRCLGALCRNGKAMGVGGEDVLDGITFGSTSWPGCWCQLQDSVQATWQVYRSPRTMSTWHARVKSCAMLNGLWPELSAIFVGGREVPCGCYMHVGSPNTTVALYIRTCPPNVAWMVFHVSL